MEQTTATLEVLEACVESLRHHVWRPGAWGARLNRDSYWSATVNQESLRIDREIYPIPAIKVAR